MRADQRLPNGYYRQPPPTPAPESSPDKPLLLTRREAAKFLAIGERTLWTLTAEGKIPCVKLGYKLVRYDVRDLVAFVDHQKRRGQSYGPGEAPPAPRP